MTASQLFSVVNPLALAGWIVLILSVVLNKPLWRDQLAGRFWSLGFSLMYSALIVFFFLPSSRHQVALVEPLSAINFMGIYRSFKISFQSRVFY